ncbi:MAG: YkgJ family cysteine cluster protein [Candidatus Latescibacteria bacterium]|nr:YkgJ family cysteine cluster protein [Candidatus Latescibacterota bacterium]
MDEELRELLTRPEVGHALDALNALYNEVPRTVCEECGECCYLTEEEMEKEIAVMFPLYSIEYINIAHHLSLHFSEIDQKKFFDVVQERPTICPFLDSDRKRCRIYAARPLVCRSYGVLSHEKIGWVVDRYRGIVPQGWLRTFAVIESSCVCPKVSVVEPLKLDLHIERLVLAEYTRKLTELSWVIDFIGHRKWKVVEKVLGVPRIVRWTWGGFNFLRYRSEVWVEKHWKTFLGKARLAG